MNSYFLDDPTEEENEMATEIFVLADIKDRTLKVQCSLVSDGKFTMNKFSINKLMCSLISNEEEGNIHFLLYIIQYI